jgi:hypothetical protein
MSDARRALLEPRLQALLAELDKIRELEPFDGEPVTPWPWEEANDVR